MYNTRVRISFTSIIFLFNVTYISASLKLIRREIAVIEFIIRDESRMSRNTIKRKYNYVHLFTLHRASTDCIATGALRLLGGSIIDERNSHVASSSSGCLEIPTVIVIGRQLRISFQKQRDPREPGLSKYTYARIYYPACRIATGVYRACFG